MNTGKYNIDFCYMHLFPMRSQCVLNRSSNQDAHCVQDNKNIAKITCGCFPTSTRKFTQKSEIFRHKTSHMLLSIIFLEDKYKIVLHLSIFNEYQQFFQHRICSRYSRPISVTRDPLQHVLPIFFLIMLFRQRITAVVDCNCDSLSVDEAPDFGQLHVCVVGLNKFCEISPPSP